MKLKQIPLALALALALGTLVSGCAQEQQPAADAAAVAAEIGRASCRERVL